MVNGYGKLAIAFHEASHPGQTPSPNFSANFHSKLTILILIDAQDKQYSVIFVSWMAVKLLRGDLRFSSQL